jgi:hypothetical protein
MVLMISILKTRADGTDDQYPEDEDGDGPRNVGVSAA